MGTSITSSWRSLPGAAAVLMVIAGLTAPAAAGPGGLTFAVVDTGQSDCYGTGRGFGPVRQSCARSGELAGQDAQYPGNPPRYEDNGDGTVSDLVTGLMWEKRFARAVPWDSAADRARAATTGGHRDWRVPTIKELYSLMNFDGATGSMRSMTSTPSDAKPYLDTTFFEFEYPTDSASSGLRFIDAQYITRTVYTGRTMGGNRTFFGVNFADGRIKGYPTTGGPQRKTYYLRLVRSNPDYGRNAFRDNGDGSVTDTATGFTWMRDDSGHEARRGAVQGTRYSDGRLDWPEALAFCEGLSFAGSDAWRLPDAKELQSLVDYTRSPQATRSAALDPMFHATRITDEGGKPNYPGYWTSTTHLDGRIPGTDAVVVYFGEALGTGPTGGRHGGGMGMGRPPPGAGFGGPLHGMETGPPPGMGRPGRGRGSGGQGRVIDVHGAGAQRGDPKVGDPDDYPVLGHGPQGDVRRVYNHVRCVRG